MTTYTFETITDAQALAFTSGDTLVSNSTTSTGSKFRVSFLSGGATGLGNIVLTDTSTGAVKTFSSGLANHTVGIASTGSALYVGDSSGNTGGVTGANLGAFLGDGDDTVTGAGSTCK